MKVKNHKAFAYFDYEQFEGESVYQLGDIVSKNIDDEVGVIIQIHDRHEFRTDMFGNCSSSEISLSTMKDIKKYRPDIVKYLQMDKEMFESELLKRFKNTESGGAGNLTTREKQLIYIATDIFDKNKVTNQK